MKDAYEGQRRQDVAGTVWTAVRVDRFSTGYVAHVRARKGIDNHPFLHFDETEFWPHEWFAMPLVADTEVSQ